LLCKPILANLAKVGAAAGTNETRYDESNADHPYEQHDAEPAAHVERVIDPDDHGDPVLVTASVAALTSTSA
jgi:hypothetical protein